MGKEARAPGSGSRQTVVVVAALRPPPSVPRYSSVDARVGCSNVRRRAQESMGADRALIPLAVALP